jgi:signal transduction histidine kinase/ligand-binding sensor domain-containing protein/CheY-like chemotaxis protein
MIGLGLISEAPAIDNQEIRFHQISIEDGLSHSLVSAYLEDDHGFLWFGTQDGLNRYDGYGFRVYHAGRGPRSPSHSWIRSAYKDRSNQIWIYYQGIGLERFNPGNELFYTYQPDSLVLGSISSDSYYTSFNINYHEFFEDSDSNLWIGTDKGLNKYLRKEDRFESLRHDPNDPHSLSDDRIITVAEDLEENLWIGTHNGLNRYDPLTGRVTRYLPEAGNPNAINDNAITYICVCPDSSIWVGTFRGGLNIIENAYSKNPRIIHLIDKPLNVNLEPTIYHIHKTGRGKMLIGTHQGLYQVSKENGNYRATLYPETRDIGIFHFKEDPAGYIWIASGQIIRNSLFRMDPDLKHIENFGYNEMDPFSFGGGRVHFLEISRTGILWIGTEKKGVFKVNLNAKKFHTINHIPRNNIALTNKEVYAIHEDQQGNLYVGTKGGLNRINPQKDRIFPFNNRLELISNLTWQYSSRLPAELIGVIAETSDHELWMGSFDYKVSLYDPGMERFLNFHHNEEDDASFTMWSLRSICVTEDDRVYFGGTEDGLCRLNEDGKSFSYYPVVKTGNSHGTNDAWIFYICEDRQGKLWLGTLRGGLNRFDPGNGTFTHYVHNPSNDASISNNMVKCILEPEVYGKDILWIGTNGGLNRFDRKTGRFTHYAVEQGMPGNSIHGILEDKRGRLWLSTNHGLALFDPHTENIRVYTVEDGLQGNEFNEGSYFKNKDGIFYFGGTNGLNYFNPEEIRDNPHKASTVITDFKLYHRSVRANDTIGRRILLRQSILHTDQIRLSRQDKVISFEFTSLHYVAPHKLKYRYILEGFEDKWNEVTTEQRFANYTNIPSGDYIFKVLSTNSDGEWSTEPTTLAIHIMPPFWEKFWFQGLISVLILLLFLAVMRIRTQILKHQKKMLTLQVEERTMDLKEVNKKLEDKQQEIMAQSEKIALQRDNLSEQNKLLEKQKLEIQQMAEKLHESDEMKLRFFTNISHEFRTPLTLIMGPTESLLQQEDFSDTEKMREELSLIYRNEKRLLRLINQLLELRRVDTGTLKLAVKEDDILAYLQEIYQQFSPLAKKRGIDFWFESELERLRMHYDADKIEKILYNLLSNALKYTPEGGRVIFSVNLDQKKNRQGNLHICVADNGCGIPPQHLPHIFDRFFQVNDPNHQYDHGSGIGLALCKELVEKHHGRISVKSTMGMGSTFKVELPLPSGIYQPDEMQTGPEMQYTLDYLKSMLASEDEPARTGTVLVEPSADEDIFRILVVEDNQDMREFLQQELQKEYCVMSANNGVDGLALAREHSPDLIISDVMMPEMDGLELCRELKTHKLTSHIPFYLLTARSEAESQKLGLEAGADDYVIKPFSIDILQLKIRNLLESRKQLAGNFAENSNYIPDNVKISQIDQGFLEKFVKMVEDHIDDPELSGDRMAGALGMSKGNLYKKLKSLTGMTVNVYIRTIRLKVAARILRQGRYNISEVAYSVGFDNPKYFSTCFSDLFSMSPKEYMGTSTH